MVFSIPIFIEERPEGINKSSSFVVRPLFYPKPVHRAEKLGRALSKLTAELQELLFELGREPRHDQLAEWTFHPTIEEMTVDLRLEMDSGSKRARFFLAGYPALGRKLFFTPTMPALHFEVFPGQSVADRATAVFTRHFRDLEKEEGTLSLAQFELQGKARLTTIDITLTPSVLAKKPQPPRRAWLFGGEEKKDGEQELRKTGRSLQSLYPDDLERAVGRDREVEELARQLASADRRPILLVGPRKVGKTTILHELVWQMCSRKKERFGGPREIWLLSPMRLISGMSYLGEWENRVLAILDHAREKDRVLYFDDLVGLLTAGMSSASDLNIAQVLRPALEKRSVRLIAEITPEAWRVLRERDRAFADLFQVIPIAEPTEPETLRVLVNVTRQLEEQYKCEFGIEAVPTAYDLHRRFAGDAAFPGKAAGFLRRLAIRHGNSRIGRQESLDEFCEQSGMQMAFLDNRHQLQRAAVLQSLKEGLAGQDQVLEAFADILLALKAKLNDPRRPLGTFLLLGPTGVGKTQSTKVLAKYLFGSSERLLRFDMNEYVDGASADRLAGTLDEPEGLLTGAIRRQPFSVLLFDEIEKAAPEVFDLLLAVLDEGRLTDALGRVADFTNSVILLTSNLGVRESRSKLGFGASQSPEDGDAVFVGAAEKFFRPEFFNRLDRIIPFRPLASAQLESIARQLIADVFARDGLRRRECLLQVSTGAMSRLVELGQNPQLGARALKRVIEREVAQPVAQRLASLPIGTPTIASVGDDGNRLSIKLKELRPVNRSIFWPEAVGQFAESQFSRLMDGVNAALDRIESELETHAPTGRVELGNLPPESARYFACREQLKKVDRIIQAAERSQQSPKKTGPGARVPKPKPVKMVVRQLYSGNPKLTRLRDRSGMLVELAEWEAGEPVDMPDSPVLALCRELALLEAMVRQPWDDRPAVLVFQPMDEQDLEFAFGLAQLYFDFLNNIWGSSAAFVFKQFARLAKEELLLRKIFGEPVPKEQAQALFLNGFNLRFLIPSGTNTVLARRRDGNLGILMTHLHEATSETEAENVARNYLPENYQARPAPVEIAESVLHMMTKKTITDYRNGLVIPGEPQPEEFRTMMLSALPLPPEIIF
jgi:ATP-dependent Clp protease ATP-binding subunit ClpA